MDQTSLRKARQIVKIDGLLGMDSVPLGQAQAQAPAESDPTPTDRSPEKKQQALDELAEDHATNCPLCTSKTDINNLVFGEGDPDADLVFVGEGPGADEDRQGRPFVGRAGQLLNKQITAMGLEREQVYIANIVKSRPPGNRVPTPEEAEQCMPWLERQMKIIQPKVIVTLGGSAAKYLLEQPNLAITKVRGQWQQWHGFDLMPTFHPAYLLRQYTTDNRRKVWSDLQAAMKKLGPS